MLLHLAEVKKSSPYEMHKLLRDTLRLKPISCFRVVVAIGNLAAKL